MCILIAQDKLGNVICAKAVLHDADFVEDYQNFVEAFTNCTCSWYPMSKYSDEYRISIRGGDITPMVAAAVRKIQSQVRAYLEKEKHETRKEPDTTAD